MEKRTKKMLLAILMIISVLAADFLVLGSGIMTYASELSSETNNTNVEFSVFFKDGENRVDGTQKSIKAEDVKLYAEIKVKNEGYLKEGTVIELENNNFNLKNEILESNTHINNIEGNKVNLKQINAGETVEIELGIEPAISDKITTDYLSQVTTVKMIGTYVYSKAEDGESIRTDKLVSVNYQPDETTGTELEADIITNTVLSVNGTNKRIVQLLIKSRITNNEYPVKQTTMSADIPEINGETPEVTAMAISELATNGTTEIDSVTTEDGKVKIVIDNNPDENNQISWNKNIYDEIVITYIYSDEVSASDIDYMDTSVWMNLYNCENPYMAVSSKNLAIGETIPESNSVIMGKTEITTEELYKGKLYTNLELNYNTETNVIITNPDIEDEIVVHEGPDVFGTDESELAANTKYVATEINLEKMLAIVGQDGNIEIKNGETTTLINKETAVDANGNVVINYENGASELYITTSKPVVAGILELKHTKAITENNYTRTQLQEVKTIITKGSVEGSITVDKEKQNVISKDMDSGSLELKETKTRAELTIENGKETLSTTQANEVTLGITLVTDGEQYDLYKNPKISLKFPEAVESVELISTPSKQNADEFAVSVGTYNSTNKTIQIDLQGEQTKYPETSLTQSYIQLKLNVTLELLTLAQTDKIIMAYINENAIQYEGGRTDAGLVEQTVQISAPSQLIKMFNLSLNENTSTTETILQQVEENQAGKTLDFGISLINNKDSSLSDLKIIGKLPTTGNTISGQDENTLETMLKGITAENATIYYTENSSATVGVEDTANGWTQDLSTLTNAKMYLIKVNSLARGETYTATVTVQLPNLLTENGLSYTQYGVVYDTVTGTDVKESSRKIGLATSLAASIKTEITAQVGQDVINNGDTVKEGEIIRYTVTLNNKGANTLENVQLKLGVPEGTTYVRPVPETITEDNEIVQEGDTYIETYYEEITDSEKLAELTTITIPQLTTTGAYSIQYEVRVNKGAANTEITNKPIVIYNETEVESTEFSNMIQESNIRVTVKRAINQLRQLYPGGTAWYDVYVENLSNETINNLEMQIISDTFNIETDKITISEINANDKVCLKIDGLIDKNANEVNTLAIVKDSNGNTYRSNLMKQTLPNLNMTINMTSSKDGQYIKEGDIVDYNITVKNNGDVGGSITIEGVIPDILQVQSLYLDGNLIKQSLDENEETYRKNISNNIFEYATLEVGKTVNLKITAKELYIPESYHGKVITSSVKITAFNILQDTSEMVTHILKAKEENLENVISGMAWLDENENGQRDGNEENLSDITVKIYDISSQNYLKTDEGNTIQTVTDVNGLYSFSNIKNGSYLVVFEYDTEKYVLTTAFAENADTSINSKAIIKTITDDSYITRLAAIELSDLNRNVFGMNLGLKENIGETPKEQQPGVEEIPQEPEEPTNPENPTTPEEPKQPSNPDNPITPETPVEPEQPTETKTVGGFAWLDSNDNGQKDKEESYLSGIKVRLFDVSMRDYLIGEDGKIVELITDANGKYEFNNIEKGSYIVIFEYNTEEYEPTTQNSNIVLKKININGKDITAAVTDTIKVQNDISNINIGLKENLKFDLELNKYISKIAVQTSKETKSYNYTEKTLGKVEIHRKQIQGALVVLEYTIKVKNTGEIAGYAKNIVDYIPNGLTFSSELNTDWYLSGNNLHTKGLENVELNPGEEKEIKLILTKTMTNENVGLTNNRAEIYQDYNKYGESDIDSIPNNQAQDEDDFGTTDVIIQVATGGGRIAYVSLIMANTLLICIAIRLMIKNRIIKLKKKGGRN